LSKSCFIGVGTVKMLRDGGGRRSLPVVDCVSLRSLCSVVMVHGLGMAVCGAKKFEMRRDALA
jgi:hypothetical protein